MKRSNIIVPSDLVVQLRTLIPKVRMSYHQARNVAELQAERLRELLGTSALHLPLEWIERLPHVTVRLLPASEMEQLTKRPWASGATDVRKDGTYRIFINEHNSPTHCRFTTAHEFYHVITGPYATAIFQDFGHGDAEQHELRMERVADHFAANLLVPKALLKQVWELPMHEVSALAQQFFVSEDTIRIRLQTVGLTRSGLTKEMFYRLPKLTKPPTLCSGTEACS